MNNLETLTTTTLTRREFLKVSGLGLAGATLLGTLGCGGGGSAAEGLVFTSSGSAYERAQTQAWLKPYSKEPVPRFARTHPPTTPRSNLW